MMILKGFQALISFPKKKLHILDLHLIGAANLLLKSSIMKGVCQMSEITVNPEKIGQDYTDENNIEWIWVEEYKQHTKKYEYDENLSLWYIINKQNGTYEPLLEIPKPKPTAEMGKYGSLRLNFIWQTPCLLKIMLNGDVVKHCEEMNEKVQNLIDQYIEKKQQTDEYKEIMSSGKYIQRVQMLESYRAEAEEQILPITVYAI